MTLWLVSRADIRLFRLFLTADFLFPCTACREPAHSAAHSLYLATAHRRRSLRSVSPRFVSEPWGNGVICVLCKNTRYMLGDKGMVSWLLNKIEVRIGFVLRFSGGRGVVYEAAGEWLCRRSAEETRRAVPEIQVHGSQLGAEETPVNAHSFKLHFQAM